MRPSPTDSATSFPVGTVKQGNDGNLWKVILTKNNIKRWKKETSTSSKPPTKSKAPKRKSKKAKSKSPKRKSKKAKSKSTKRKSKKSKSVKRKSKKTKKSKSVKRKSKKSKKSKSVKRKSKKAKKSKSVKRKSKKAKKSKSVKRKSKKAKSKSVKRKSKKAKKSKSVKRKSKKSKSVKRKSNKDNSEKQETPKPIPKPTGSFNPNTFSAMLAHKYNGEDPIGYYLSEKLDGYRAIFYKNGDSAGFISRNNKPFNAPEWFINDIASRLPDNTVLDGELYTKRNDFEGMGVVRKKIPVDSEWRKITFMVFDLPLIRKPFKERYQIMSDLLKDLPHVKLVEHIEIKSIEQFNDIHKKLVSEGAEGTMLRKPDSYYENKRSNVLLKVKDFLDDEAVVEGMEFGDGRNSNVMGNLIVKWAPHANKKYTGTFDVGSGFTDEQRKNWKTLFKKGTIITIKYFEIQNSGKPRFPIFQNIYHKV